MATVSGRVVVKETGIPVPNVLVAVQDLGTGIPISPVVPPVPPAPPVGPVEPAGAVAVAAPPAGTILAPQAISLGSRVTDADGRFEIDYNDPSAGGIAPLTRMPTLQLAVLAPEDGQSTIESRTLFSSNDLRRNVTGTEEYLIAIGSEVLTTAGIPLPIDPSVAKTQPEAVVGQMKQAMDYHLSVTDEARTLAAQQVATVRANAKTVDAAVQTSLLESLTGVSAADAARLNIVQPGAKPDATVWTTVNKTIDETVNTSTLAGYVVLSDQEAQQFRAPDGSYRQGIAAAEIEPYIFQADDASRPVSILRSDPLAALARADAPDPFGSTPTPPAPGGGNGAAPDEPVTSADLPKFVGRLVDPMVAPEDYGTAIGARPTVADVTSSVGSLQVAGGPADVTAFYDFHQLQIAFDYVWQQAIDAGAIETAQVLCRQLADQGGDPVSALQSGGDPVAALRDEVRHVATAQQSLQQAGVAYRMAQNGHEPNGGPPPPPPHTPPAGRPPIVRPVLTGTLIDPGAPSPEPGDLLAELTEMLSERYSFEVFAPGSTNFGLFITYRARLDPIAYQVGNLAKTLTLAPKETRKVTSKRTVKVERSVKEMQDNLQSRKDDTSETMRDEAEVVQRAQQKTSFSLTAKGSYDIGISSGDSTMAIGRDAEASSQETKKDFHEAVLKSAQEFKDERKLEVETKVSQEDETTESIELTNPNDELTVTYLFYELQRRFRLSEHLHRVTPVVLVALDVPNPNRDAIDRILLTQSWIINRVLLDDRYRAPLEYLCTRVVGDELALDNLEANVAQVSAAVEELKSMHKDLQAELVARETALETAIAVRANSVGAKDNEGWLSDAVDAVIGSSGTDPQQAQILEDAAKDAYDRAVQAEKDLRMRLDAETAALSAATEAFAKARAEHGNRLLQVAGLRSHFKENVLYYMQAIWSFTFRDELFFSLCNIKVPKLTAAQKTYDLKVPDHVPLSIAPKPGQVVLEVDAKLQLDTNLDPAQDFVTLAEVADLDNPLGFKGNYMIFPLRASNPLTDFMMTPYLDSELGIHDPDELGSWTPEDFAAYAQQLLAQQKDTLSPSDYAALVNRLEQQYREIVSNPAVRTDVVIVPTSSLYIEALPGAHPLLENFKLEHRAIDVQKAKAETRKLELENLRYAARVLAAELGDPEIEKQVLVEGAAGVAVGDS